MLKEERPAADRSADSDTSRGVPEVALDVIVRTFGMEEFNNRPAIIFEDFAGKPLHTVSGKLNFSVLLEVASKIADSLDKIHCANVIHKNITPSNILFNSSTGEIKIINFEIAGLLSSENPQARNPTALEGTLPSISPRANRQDESYVGLPHRFLFPRRDTL